MEGKLGEGRGRGWERGIRERRGKKGRAGLSLPILGTLKPPMAPVITFTRKRMAHVR